MWIHSHRLFRSEKARRFDDRREACPERGEGTNPQDDQCGWESRGCLASLRHDACQPEQLFRRHVRGGDAAVHGEFGPGDIGGLIGREIERRIRHLLGLAKTAHGDVHQSPLFLGFCVQEFHQQ